jgi:hypothetical protein
MLPCIRSRATAVETALPWPRAGYSGWRCRRRTWRSSGAAIEAYIDGDHDAYRAVMAEDAEVCPDVSPFPEAKQFRGRAEYGRFLTEIHQGWEGGAG